MRVRARTSSSPTPIGRTERVLAALLDAVPTSRMVQMRDPQLKERPHTVSRPPRPVRAAPADAYMAHRPRASASQRLCAGESRRLRDFYRLRQQHLAITERYDQPEALRRCRGGVAAVGGETCTDAYSPQNVLRRHRPIAGADAELRRLGLQLPQQPVQQRRQRRLGDGGLHGRHQARTRLPSRVTSGTYTSTVAPYQALDLALSLRNVGYATPFMREPCSWWSTTTRPAGSPRSPSRPIDGAGRRLVRPPISPIVLCPGSCPSAITRCRSTCPIRW